MHQVRERAMYQFASGIVCELIGMAAIGIAAPQTAVPSAQGSFEQAIAVDVNRAAKGDRLDTGARRESAAWKKEFNTRNKERAVREENLPLPAKKLEKLLKSN